MRRLGIATIGLGGSLLAGFAMAPDAAAQESATAAPANHAEGRIIYSRDVHHSVGAPYFPGQTHSVVTGPTNTITGAITNGLVPLTDEESGFVTASLAAPVAVSALLETGLAPIAGGAATPAAGERSGTPVGGMIGGAMGSLTAALGAMRTTLGSRP